MKKTPLKKSPKATKKKIVVEQPSTIERFTEWVGSASSLVFHTLLFIVFFVLSFLNILPWNRMLLVLTTIVSLEAIYLAIFIQMTVNRQSETLEEVERDIDEIQEDVDEIQEDIEEISEDEEEDEARQQRQMITLETLTKDVERLLKDIEEFQKKK